MKRAREYRSLAWDVLRSNFKQSSLVVLLTYLVAMVGVGALIGAAVYWIHSRGFVSASIMSAVLIAFFLTVSLLNYYLPVWYMSMLRKEPARWYDVRTSYWRALLASLLIMMPNVLSQSVNGLSQWLQHSDSLSPTVKMIMALVIMMGSMLVLVFVLWYSYSIGIMLPYKVYDQEDRSVFGLVKDTFRMMKGYRWKLFCVDFFILVWPLGIVYFLCLVMVVVLALNAGDLIDGNAFLGAMVVTGIFLSVVIFALMFLFEPMRYFAHAQFYEELKGEN